MRLMIVTTFLVALIGLSSGCSKGNPTVAPADAVKVPADAPVGEEKPSNDEK
ncbi:hypothetical protein [Anatilimnocola floriformis]|uniref:hypothetical protein n=1 Tax=Anatilimnocola floriformis TaxID=2948575 RepID=UPI0020C20951|nr:hypothetical protein [Anatilimnocola floriformis]